MSEHEAIGQFFGLKSLRILYSYENTGLRALSAKDPTAFMRCLIELCRVEIYRSIDIHITPNDVLDKISQVGQPFDSTKPMAFAPIAEKPILKSFDFYLSPANINKILLFLAYAKEDQELSYSFLIRITRNGTPESINLNGHKVDTYCESNKSILDQMNL